MLSATVAATALQTEDAAQAAQPTDTAMMLWYGKPAPDWLHALPIGNGRIGAMVFGGVEQERLQLNEANIWAGGPHDYANPDGPSALPEIRRLIFDEKWADAQKLAEDKFVGKPMRQAPYQTVGDLTLTFAKNAGEVTEYRRSLDLENAVAQTEWSQNGVRFARQAWASYPDQVLIVQLTADKPGAISFDAAFSGPMPDTKTTARGSDTLVYSGRSGDTEGRPGQVRFAALVRAQSSGGTVEVLDGNRLRVTNTANARLLISIGTNYKNYAYLTGDPLAVAQTHLDKAAQNADGVLLRSHAADYQKRFKTVNIDLGGPKNANTKPTDARVAAFGDGKTDPGLVALHFQYGRYLLLSSSRAGSGQPANLQGIWNDQLSPPWGSKFTDNINTEMNYYPAGPANLLDTYAPLFDLIADLSITGRKTAQTHWGAKRGWVCHHNTDGWRGTAPVDPAFYGQWPLGGAWLCKSLWDYWEYSGGTDLAALKRHYPLMKGAAEFFLETLVEEPTHKYLVLCPDMSPEKAHHPNVSICAGATMSGQIVRDLFDACIHASEILNTDAAFRQEVQAARARLAPMQISKSGVLQEWLHDWDADAPDQHHRHISHLYGLHPSHQITRRGTPDLFEAARKTLETRGDAATGWSLAWKINFWARMENGDRAYKLITDLLTPAHTAPNLFDLHPPFQIDGNFGAVSGVCEMLLQSHSRELHLLPALPSAWPTGRVSGLRARGGATVSLQWKNGQLERADITPIKDGPVVIRSGEKTLTRDSKANKTLRVTPKDFAA